MRNMNISPLESLEGTARGAGIAWNSARTTVAPLSTILLWKELDMFSEML